MTENPELLDGYREKLVRRKQEWARDGRLIEDECAPRSPEDRLPPGQRLVEIWPVLDLGVQPEIPKAKWIFTIDGLVENPISWKWDDFLAQPQVNVTSDVHCVTGWSRYDNAWTGVHVGASAGAVPSRERGDALPDLRSRMATRRISASTGSRIRTCCSPIRGTANT